MTVKNIAFIDVEESLSQGMHRAWMREQGAQLIRELKRLIEQDLFTEAYQLVDTLNFAPTVARRQGLIESQATAAYILGQSFWTNGDLESTLLGGGEEPFPVEIDMASQALAASWSNSGTAEARKAARALIAAAQEETEPGSLPNAGMITRKALIPGLETALNTAVRQNTQVSFALGANITTSRLASLGALKQAIANGVSRFQRTAILDNRVCPVCRSLHGQPFPISTQVNRLLTLLRTQDPKELTAAAPFPKQNKAALAKMATMSEEEIVQNGWELPPSHSLCRCILVPVGTVPSSELVGPAAFKIPGVRLNTTFAKNAAESAALAEEAATASNVLNIAKNAKTSKKLYTNANGQYTKGRKVVHDDIMAKTLEGAVAQEQPTFHMMGGGTASGKSSAVRAGKVKFPKNNVFIDSDEIKKQLPEFSAFLKAGDSRAASFVHQESSFISEKIMQKAAKSNFNTVLDGVGDGGFEKLSKRVGLYKDKGYKIKADYVSADLEVAIKRAVARGKQTGRVVPKSLIRENHAGVSRDFKRAVDANLFDDVKLWDTSKGGTPELVFSMKNGKQVIHDQTLWDNFLAKAQA